MGRGEGRETGGGAGVRDGQGQLMGTRCRRGIRRALCCVRQPSQPVRRPQLPTLPTQVPACFVCVHMHQHPSTPSTLRKYRRGAPSLALSPTHPPTLLLPHHKPTVSTHPWPRTRLVPLLSILACGVEEEARADCLLDLLVGPPRCTHECVWRGGRAGCRERPWKERPKCGSHACRFQQEHHSPDTRSSLYRSMIATSCLRTSCARRSDRACTQSCRSECWYFGFCVFAASRCACGLQQIQQQTP